MYNINDDERHLGSHKVVKNFSGLIFGKILGIIQQLHCVSRDLNYLSDTTQKYRARMTEILNTSSRVLTNNNRNPQHKRKTCIYLTSYVYIYIYRKRYPGGQPNCLPPRMWMCKWYTDWHPSSPLLITIITKKTAVNYLYVPTTISIYYLICILYSSLNRQLLFWQPTSNDLEAIKEEFQFNWFLKQLPVDTSWSSVWIFSSIEIGLMGMTRKWTGACGFTSWKARHFSSW